MGPAAMKIVSVLLLTMCLSGCTSLAEKPDPVLLAEILGDQDGFKEEAVDLLRLSDDLKSFVDARIDRGRSSSRRLEALHKILFQPDLFAIDYESGKTKTALETYESGSGNCLSMTNLFIAMARYSDIDAHYHLVKAQPEWDQSGATLISIQHINSTGVLGSGDRYILDFLPGLSARRSDIKTVSDQYAQAIYFTNIGAEAMLAGRYDEAVNHLRNALRLEPSMADAWNNMGATLHRLKKIDLAKASFLQAIVLEPFNGAAMSNLSRIYEAEGLVEMGVSLKKRVAKHRLKNPYYRYANAREMLTREDWLGARQELNAAIRLKDDEQDFYNALAEAYAGLGDMEKHNTSLQLARLNKAKAERRLGSLEIYRSGKLYVN